jgi:DNA-binding transcriptional LysR family regulator
MELRLTPEGAGFLAEAEAVVRQADRAAEVARALAQGASGQLRLSHLRTMPRGLPERVVGEYRQRYPGVAIIPESGSTEQDLERLRAGQVDLAFVLTPLGDDPGLGCVDIATEPVVVALPSSVPPTLSSSAATRACPGQGAYRPPGSRRGAGVRRAIKVLLTV